MGPTLLEQMEESATNHAVPVAALLRKGLILSRRLRYRPLGEWARMELGGYGEGVTLPEYRSYRRCQVEGDFNGAMGSQIRGQSLPSSTVAETDRDSLFGYALSEGIPKYQALVDGDGKSIGIPWDQNFVVKYQGAFIEGYALAGARRILNRADITQVLEGVRTRLLDFSLEIQEANPDAGEARSGDPAPVPQEEVSQAFHLHVYGNNNFVTAAGRDVEQRVSIRGNRWQDLQRALHDLGISDAQLLELRTALESDAALSLPSGTMGPSTSSWYERLSSAIASGAVTLSTDTAAAMIATELLKFLGVS
jgi:AbiTii